MNAPLLRDMTLLPRPLAGTRKGLVASLGGQQPVQPLSAPLRLGELPEASGVSGPGVGTQQPVLQT